MRLACAAAVLVLSLPAPASDALDPDLYRVQMPDGLQVADASGNPADKAGEGKKEDGEKKEGVVVEEKRVRPSESEKVGPYNQPAWSLHRRFSTVRVYVQTPPGQVEFEQWVEYRVKRGTHNHDEVRLKEEFEFGLPCHFQLDLYLVTEHVRNDTKSSLDWHEISAELRWAPFDWNVLPFNPTLYFEYAVANGGPDVIEPKLLFGGDIVDRLHWGVNFVYEGTVLGRHHSEQSDEWSCNAGLSYGVIDNTLGVGLEADYTYTIERSRNPATVTRFEELLVGPTVQWRPLDQMHIDLSVLRNVANDHEGKRAKIFLVFGYEF